MNKSLYRAYPHAFAVPERKVDALWLLFVKVLMMIWRWVEAITTWLGLFKFRGCFSHVLCAVVCYV